MPTHVYDGIPRFRMATTRSMARERSGSDVSVSSTFATTVCSISVFISVLQLAEKQEQPAEEGHHLQSGGGGVQPAERRAPRIALGEARWSSANLCLHACNL